MASTRSSERRRRTRGSVVARLLVVGTLVGFAIGAGGLRVAAQDAGAASPSAGGAGSGSPGSRSAGSVASAGSGSAAGDVGLVGTRNPASGTAGEGAMSSAHSGSADPSVEANSVDTARDLMTGFIPDPLLWEGHVLGRSPANALHTDCSGFVESEPTRVFEMRSRFGFLRMYAVGSGNLVLAVRLANGEWLCSDDRFGLHPSVEGLFPPGETQVWIGTASPGAESEYSLSLTETRSIRPGADGSQGGESLLLAGDLGLTADAPTGLHGDISLRRGFLPDPRWLSGEGGGAVDVGLLGGTCRGRVTAEPSHVVELRTDFDYVQFYLHPPEVADAGRPAERVRSTVIDGDGEVEAGEAADAGTGDAADAGTGDAADAGTGDAADAGTGDAADAGTGGGMPLLEAEEEDESAPWRVSGMVEARPSLLVLTPDGRFLCDSDTGEHQAVSARSFAQGTYRIWVGASLARVSFSYRLGISEVRRVD